MPKASIVIRTFNEERHVGNLLRAIAEQDYKNYEIIVVDSGSTDKTLKILEQFPVKIVKIESRDFTFGYALNVGCEASSGEYLVFVSAHVLPVGNSWLSNLTDCLKNEKVSMVYGRQIGTETSKFSERMDFKRMFGTSALNSKTPLIYANNANSAIRRDLWEKRKFDEYLFGLEDIDWARAMTAQGYIVHYEPKSAVYHIHEEKWHQVFNRYRREAIAAVRIGLDHPPQARVSIVWAAFNVFLDLLNSFPNYSKRRLEEIICFRYYQWKGCRTGWRQGRGIDFDRERNEIFKPIENLSVVIKDRGSVRLEETPIPEMKPGDILIKVDYVGVCRTDLEVFDGTLGYYRNGLAQYPIVPGHEFSGTIVRIGSNNKFQERFKIGQRVVGECILARGSSEKKEVGVINYNGAYSTYIMMPGDAIHKIPDELDSKTAALAEPLAVVLRGVRRIKDRLKEHSSVAVMGAGPIGNLCAQVLSHDGHNVTIFDKNPKRLNALRDTVKNTSESIQNLEQFDILVETTGSKEVLERVIKESCNDSTILLLGFPYGSMHYNFEDLVGYEKMLAGSVGGDRDDFLAAIELLPKLNVTALTHQVLPLQNFKRAWKLYGTGKHLKILLKP